MDRRRLLDDLRGRVSAEVLAAVARVDRAAFVPEDRRDDAWTDAALPIGDGQTISQPSLVAWCLDRLDVRPHHRVLEVGTGSGYAAALLGCLADEVHTVESRPALADAARPRLAPHVHVHVGDGSLGWPDAAPYDRVLVSAGAPGVPPAIKAQLAPEGRAIVPVGPQGRQQMTLVRRTKEGFVEEHGLKVSFVPLEGEAGY